MTLASFSADLGMKRQHGSVAIEQYPNGFVVSYRTIMLGKRGWFWWRRWVTMGVTPMTLEQQEMTLTKDDYFAPFPDVEFPESITIEV